MTDETLSKEHRERIWSREQPVVPFPYQWVINGGYRSSREGDRTPVKNIGLTESQRRGAQGDDVPLQSTKKI